MALDHVFINSVHSRLNLSDFAETLDDGAGSPNHVGVESAANDHCDERHNPLVIGYGYMSP